MKNEISNKDLASDLIKGQRKRLAISNPKQATAIRVAGHRLGHVITITKNGARDFTLTKAGTKVSHRPKAKPVKKANGKPAKALKKAA